MHLLFTYAVQIFQFRPIGGAVVLQVFFRASPEVFSPGSFCLPPVHIRAHKDNSSPESGTWGTETQQQKTHTCSVLIIPKCLQQYLKGFLGDLLHCQPAIFCKELQDTNTNKTHIDSGQTCSEEQDNNLQVLKVILLYILGKVVHLEAKQESLNKLGP